MIVVVCGVSGSGKSTVGALLARSLGVPFYDGDDFHPKDNVEKMKSGRPLDDNDREPWLDALCAKIREWADAGGAVLACSALKENHRDRLASGWTVKVRWVFLTGSEALLTGRINARVGHFFDPALLQSQLKALELPDYGLRFDVTANPETITDLIAESLANGET